MQNPWFNLPEVPPFVLDCDKPDILAYNQIATEAHRIHLEILPEPYTGNPEAPIILLTCYPRFNDENEKFGIGDEYFRATNRANLTHANMQYPFYLLDPRNELSPGYDWWSKKLKQPIELYGAETVARAFFAAEYFPYPTQKFRFDILIPSQEYTFSLVREAVNRQALIIQMCGQKTWFEAIPELSSYGRYYMLRTQQNPTISERNCPEGFAEIRRELDNLSVIAGSSS